MIASSEHDVGRAPRPATGRRTCGDSDALQQPPRRASSRASRSPRNPACPDCAATRDIAPSPPVTTTSGTAQSSAPAAAAPTSIERVARCGGAATARRRTSTAAVRSATSSAIADADDETGAGAPTQPRRAAARSSPARRRRKPRQQAASATASAATRPGVSVSGRAAVNQNSGDVTASSAARNAMRRREADRHPELREDAHARRVPAITPQNARPAAARRSRSHPGAIDADRARRRLRERDEHRIAGRMRTMARDVERARRRARS